MVVAAYRGAREGAKGLRQLAVSLTARRPDPQVCPAEQWPVGRPSIQRQTRGAGGRDLPFVTALG